MTVCTNSLASHCPLHHSAPRFQEIGTGDEARLSGVTFQGILNLLDASPSILSLYPGRGPDSSTTFLNIIAMHQHLETLLMCMQIFLEHLLQKPMEKMVPHRSPNYRVCTNIFFFNKPGSIFSFLLILKLPKSQIYLINSFVFFGSHIG
jgi:hypothetical protein